MAKKAKPQVTDTTDYRHPGEKRKNIPPAKIAAEGSIPKVKKVRYSYSPHLPPVLRFDATGKADKVVDRVEELLHKATKYPLTPAEASEVRESLFSQQPWLEWAGKREQQERGWFEVDPVALHIHERVSARACMRAALREDVQKDLFADPQQPYREAVQFYRHDIDWVNRLVLGDSLQVTASLAARENLAGKVQMIFMDPPYGIQYKSNFQPAVGRVDVKDRDQDLTREFESVKAFRDSWSLGTHSYLSYLRDRFVVCRELLSDTGSIFVQIGEDNVHRVREILDGVFGQSNCVSEIVFLKTSGSTTSTLPAVHDVLLWYRKGESLKFRPIYERKIAGEVGATGYTGVLLRSGEIRPLGSFESGDGTLSIPEGADLVAFGDYTSQSPGSRYDNWLNGTNYRPEPGYWKTDSDGMERIKKAGRLHPGKKFPAYLRRISDFPAFLLGNVWTDTLGQNQFGGKKVYATQTALKVVERCMLMATDPGDLVFDPTCGSGTTAVIAERWGRRWITVDTSRVAIAIARQRLLTSRFEHFKFRPLGPSDIARNPGGAWLRDPGHPEGPPKTFRCQVVAHIMPSSITQNSNLDPIFEKHDVLLENALEKCNLALSGVKEDLRKALTRKLTEKVKEEGKRSIAASDQRRWDLPAKRFEHWTVPFDTDVDWPADLRAAVESYRRAWRTKMNEVDACIEANAEREELIDQPEVEKGVVRVSGPFTVEGVRPEELSLGEEGLFDGTPNEFEAEESGPDPRLTNLHAYLGKMVQSLRGDGLTFLNNKRQKFGRVESLFESATGSVLHAEGIWEKEGAAGDELLNEPATVAITFGPQYGPVSAQQVEEAIRASKRYDELVVAGFSFDAEASAVIEESSHPKLRIHAAYIRPDINPGMDGLLKETPGSQLFTVFGQPDVDVERSGEDWVVELKGVDIYDPVANTVRSTGADKVAAWFLDQDFDGRTFCITQAFFPDQDAWEKLAKALKGSADPEAFEAFKGTKSLPFTAGKHNRVAVKVIDPRGNEVMSIRKLEG